MVRRWQWLSAIAIILGVMGCNSSTVDPDMPGAGPSQSEIVVLNSLSKTIQQFNMIDGKLAAFGTTIQLGANYDGEALDFVSDVWVTSTSQFGGSQIIFGSFSTGEQAITTFPGDFGALADAGKPTIVLDAAATIGAFVPARAEDAIYVAFPGQSEAQRMVEETGTFLVRALPAGDFIIGLDANLDDDAGTFAPLGPPKMTLYEFRNGSFFDELEITGAFGATDALIAQDELVFLAGGSFDPVTFQPAGDGKMALINISDRGIRDFYDVGGNGISMEPGRNGLLYIVRTKGPDTYETDVLTFNFFTGEFDRGPGNPLQPKDSDGSDLSCWVVTAFITGEILCATFEAAVQGRLVLLDSDALFIDEIPVGAGTTDIIIRN
jgi:hypothetical protein